MLIIFKTIEKYVINVAGIRYIVYTINNWEYCLHSIFYYFNTIFQWFFLMLGKTIANRGKLTQHRTINIRFQFYRFFGKSRQPKKLSLEKTIMINIIL